MQCRGDHFFLLVMIVSDAGKVRLVRTYDTHLFEKRREALLPNAL